MKRDPDLDALAEALKRAQDERPSWLARLAGRVLAKAAPFLAVAVAVSILLAMAGVDLGRARLVMFYGSPFIAAAVASFVAHAWRQNTGLTYAPPDSALDMAEPGQVGQVDEVGQASPAGQVARPVPPATVTVTVLPTPVAALPQATGQDRPIYYAPEPEEEDTGA